MSQQEILAGLIRDSHTLLLRYVKGFDDTNGTKQFEHLPNHALWTIGHVALTMYRVAEKLDGSPPPASVFLDGHVGDAVRFACESVAFGSRPKPDASIYPSFERACEILRDSVERLAGAFAASSDATLEKQVTWGTTMVAAHTLAARICFHNGTHAGQLADLRRAMKMGSIFG